MKNVFPILVVLVLAGCGKGGPFEDPDRKHEKRLKPAITFVEGTLKSQRRLPTQDEFRKWKETQPRGMYTLRDRTDEYAASKGATNVNDYMVGTWRADWYHYYKSWDGKYLNASDEYSWP